MSESAHLSSVNIPSLFLWDIEVVQYAIVGHDSESPIALIKGNCLESLLNFALGEAQVTVKVLAHHLQE